MIVKRGAAQNPHQLARGVSGDVWLTVGVGFFILGLSIGAWLVGGLLNRPRFRELERKERDERQNGRFMHHVTEDREIERKRL